MERLNIYIALSVVVTVAHYTNADNKMDPRIMDGIPTTIDQFPHSVLMYITGRWWWGGASHKCGSSVLNQVVLLTAAHCLKKYDMLKYRMELYAGHEDYTKSTVRRKIKTFLIHPGYRYAEHDIAILILKDPLPLGDKIKRVIIKMEFPNVEHAVLAAWGRIAGNRTTTLLQSTIQVILPKEICAKYYKPTPGTFCAGDPSGVLGRGAKGDSGSALMVKSQQIGIVAFGNVKGSFGITYYTNISYYYTWIKVLSQQKYCELK